MSALCPKADMPVVLRDHAPLREYVSVTDMEIEIKFRTYYNSIGRVYFQATAPSTATSS